MNSLRTIFLFALSIALGAWGVLDSRQEIRDGKAGVEYLKGSGARLIVASLLVGGMSLVSLQAGRRRRRRQLRRGDVDFLSGQLIALGLEKSDMEELQIALEADPPHSTGRSFSAGEQLNVWIHQAVGRLAKKYPDNTASQLQRLVYRPILEYYGWD